MPPADTPRVRALDRELLGTFVIGVVWLALLGLRRVFMEARCAKDPSSCALDTVNAFDRVWMGPSRPLAGLLSDWTQTAAAVLAASSVLVLHLLRSKGGFSRKRALAEDLLFLVQCAFVNGASLEIVRFIAQRPRPFVIQEPLVHGGNLAHYTAFYSGHTSFAAAMAMGGMWVLWIRGVKKSVRAAHAAVALLLVAATGSLRVIDQAHYASDVIAGAFAGASAAFLLAHLRWRA